MKKIIFFLLITISILSLPSLYMANAGEIQVQLQDTQCDEDGKLIVHYGLNSTFDFDYPNVTVGFKVEEEGKVIACNETKVEVPKGSDGSETKELTFNIPCIEKSYQIRSAVFYYVKRYRIDEWFSDCN